MCRDVQPMKSTSTFLPYIISTSTWITLMSVTSFICLTDRGYFWKTWELLILSAVKYPKRRDVLKYSILHKKFNTRMKYKEIFGINTPKKFLLKMPTCYNQATYLSCPKLSLHAKGTLNQLTYTLTKMDKLARKGHKLRWNSLAQRERMKEKKQTRPS